jgi:hypothetical protein
MILKVGTILIGTSLVVVHFTSDCIFFLHGTVGFFRFPENLTKLPKN